MYNKSNTILVRNLINPRDQSTFFREYFLSIKDGRIYFQAFNAPIL